MKGLKGFGYSKVNSPLNPPKGNLIVYFVQIEAKFYYLRDK